MKTVTLLMTLVLVPDLALAATGELKRDATRMDGAISAYTPVGRMLFPTREVLVEGTYPSGRPVRGNLFVVFDASTGHFLWVSALQWAPPELVREPGRIPTHELRMTKGMQSDSRGLYVGDDKIVAFSVAAPLKVLIRETAETARNLDAAEDQGFLAATGQLGAFEQQGSMHGWREVDLFKVLGRDFIAPQHGNIIADVPRIVDVGRNDNTWSVVFDCNWKARVTLNEKYEVIKVERIQ